MATRRNAASARTVRKCATIPAPPAEHGFRAEAEEQLKASYEGFLVESDSARKNEAGRDLIRAIFGKDSIADDTIL